MSDNKHIFKNSSVCNHCDYYDNDNTLILKFHSHTLCHTFQNVPKVVYENLKKSESVGKYFHSAIRGKYREGAMRVVE